MVSMNMVDCGMETLVNGKTNYYNFGICYFSTKHAALMSKNKDSGSLRVRVEWHVYLWMGWSSTKKDFIFVSFKN